MDPKEKVKEEDGDRKEPLLTQPEQLTEEKRGDPGHMTQILVVIGISFGCYIHGTSVVWPIVLPKLISQSNASLANSSTAAEYIGFHIDPATDVSWIVSIFVLGNFLGSVVSAPLSNTVGRKLTCMLGIGVTFALSYLLVVTAVEVSMLYLARVLMGVALGVSTTVSIIYIQDISTPDIRGSLGAIPAVTGALGVFSFQILNAFLSWRHLNVICACLSVPYCIFLVLAPESPVFLVSRGRIGAARSALKRLRGRDWNSAGELEDIKERLETVGKSKSKTRLSFNAFLSKQVFYPVFLSFMLILLMNLSGISIIMSYTVQIFQTANSSIDEFLATIYLGIALLASNVLTVLLAHKLPRRLMLILSALGVSTTLGIMGLSYQLREWAEQEDSETSYGNFGWLPLLTLMVYIFMFNLGFGSMVFITASELLPPHIRELGMSLSISLNCPVSFLVNYSFPFLMESIKGQGCFWLYSIVSFAGFLFIVFLVPETRGKTDQQIQQQFQKKLVVNTDAEMQDKENK